MTRYVLFAFFLMLPLGASASASTASEAKLFQLIEARLALMKPVAAYKWQHHLPVEFAAREKVVLDSAADAAQRAGLKRPGSVAFFRAQIAAAKEVEAYWFKRFKAGLAPPPAPDLKSDIRPKLLDLGAGITATLGELPDGVSAGSRAAFVQQVNVEGLTDATRLALFNALTNVERYRNRLEQIEATHELRVGTTGDYPPFSAAVNGDYRGIDIDLARNLARSLGAHVTFVHTTWQTLVQDLQAGKFDIAMSGVSRTPARAKLGFFSVPYFRGGKTAIARCTDARKYRTLAKIDRPGVTVIVNPGGTNQAFDKTHLKHARVIVFDDNRKIFDALAAGRADVMITDAIEVALQTKLHKSLCATMPGRTLSRQDKAYFMPRDKAWRRYVDRWLRRRIADDTVAKAFQTYLR